MLGEYMRSARLRHVAMFAAMLADNVSLDHALRNDMKSFAGCVDVAPCPKVGTFFLSPVVSGEMAIPNPT